jgi:hypothetical protein
MRVMVVACYRPKPGKDADLLALMNTHLPTLRAEGLVAEGPSLCGKAKDGAIVEVFEWKSQDAISAAHENKNVLAMWEKYAAVCDFVTIGDVAESKEMFSPFEPIAPERPSQGRLDKAIPLFASLNMDETEGFYRDKLGFVPRSRYGDDYLIMSRDAVMLNFWPCKDRHIAENTSAYFNVTNIEALYDDFQKLGPDTRMTKVKTFDYGMKEFHVWDVHGNLLRFGEAVG